MSLLLQAFGVLLQWFATYLDEQKVALTGIQTQVQTLGQGVGHRLDQIMAAVQQNQKLLGELKTAMADLKTILSQIDTATNQTATTVAAIGSNMQVVSTATTKLGTDVDALIASLQTAGVPQDIIAQATAISANAGTLATASAGVAASVQPVIDFLNATAAKAEAAVPVVPPPPPPPQL